MERCVLNGVKPNDVKGLQVLSLADAGKKEWRPICYTHQNYNTKLSLTAEPSRNNVLQFPRKQVIEWVEELKKSRGGSNAKTASYLGLSPSYVSKFLTSCR